MKKLRLLMLDDETTFLAPLQMLGVEIELIQPEKDSQAVYKPPVLPVREKVRHIMAEGNIDVVVLGNNEGAGVWWGQLVDEKMRGRTIIVWNTYRSEMRNPYVDMGFKLFSSRRDLSDMILKMFPEIAPANAQQD